MSYDAWKQRNPQDEDDAAAEQLEREEEERAEREADARWWAWVMDDERASAEAAWRDVAAFLRGTEVTL